MTDVFISYSRKDVDFVRRLHTALAAQSRDTWVDWEDIPLTADWWREVQVGIEAADAFVFVISPDSVRSEICRREIEHAVTNNKRLIPILYREVSDAAEQQLMHPAISSHNWIFFRDTDNFDAAVRALIDSLNTDLSYVRAHTRLLVRAREWDNRGRNPSFLLQGDNLRDAETWLGEAVGNEPPPLPLHAEYIAASRQAAARRQRVLLAGVSVALVVSTALAVIALALFGEANTQRMIADQNAATAVSAQGEALNQAAIAQTQAAIATVAQGEAERQAQFVQTQAALIAAARAESERQRNIAQAQATAVARERDRAQSIGLAGQAQYEQAGIRPDRALLLALEALRNYAYTWQAERALANAVQTSFARETLDDHRGAVYSVEWSPTQSQVVTASEDNTARIFDPATGVEEHVLSHEGVVNRAMWSPDGTRVATASADGTAQVWDAATGERLLTLRGHTGSVYMAAWSPGGTRIATASGDNTARVWDAETGALLFTLTGHTAPVNVVAWSPDGTRLATASDDRTAVIWNAATGAEIVTLNGHTRGVNRVAWSPDGIRVATASSDRTARIWDVTTGITRATLTAHIEPVTRVAWSPTGERLVTASGDNTARIWNPSTSELLFTLFGHTDDVLGVDWSPGGRRLLTTSRDRTTRLWDAETGAQMLVLTGHIDSVYSADWAPSGEFVATASQDTTARVWQTWTTADRLVAFAEACCETRPLTDEERQQFGLPIQPGELPPDDIPDCPTAPETRLYPGARGAVTDADELPLRVRTGPGLNNQVVDQIPPRQTFRVLEGPVCADGFAWYRVIFGISAVEGWIAEGTGGAYFAEPIR